MNPSKEDALLTDALRFVYGNEEEESSDAPPPPKSKPPPERRWEPDLNFTQRLIWDDQRENVFGHGEKGSGKSIGFEHKAVRHLYDNNNALVLAMSPNIRAGNEGFWYDLETKILPRWKQGIGLEFTNSKLDPLTKDRHRWIRNRHGAWSKILLMSIPHSSMVEQRIKQIAPSMVSAEELTDCDGPEYYTFAALQLGRREGITGPQQYCASMNPKGPSHWVYKLLFEEHADDPEFGVHHVPITENRHRLPRGYIERLERTLKNNPTLRDRLINGVWVDMPTGEGLFKEYYVPDLHVKGNIIKGHGLLPMAGFPILIGYDLGQKWSSATFLQCIPTATGKAIWIVFDEVDHLGEKILYKKMAWEIMARMEFWRKKMNYQFQFMHIADESAINQWRPGGEGSYDAWEFEKEYNRQAKDKDERKIKILGCPKGDGSVAARIRLLQGKLYQEEFFVSALCTNTVGMLLNIEAHKEDPDKPARGKWIHKFDSVTYPMFKIEMGGGMHLKTQQVVPRLTYCGRG
jgi:hypothetical protein